MSVNIATHLLLGLRNHAQQVDVVTPNGSTQPVLGTRHPEDADAEKRRLNVVKQWGVAFEAPRRQRQAAIAQPLPQRSQAILSWEVPPELRQILNGGPGKLADSRRHNQDDTDAPLLPPDC
jgi:hypothetical protein